MREGAAPFAPPGREPTTFTWEEIKSWVPETVWDPDLRAALDDIAAQTEAARFAPQLAHSLDLTTAWATLDQAMTQLEGAR